MPLTIYAADPTEMHSSEMQQFEQARQLKQDKSIMPQSRPFGTQFIVEESDNVSSCRVITKKQIAAAPCNALIIAHEDANLEDPSLPHFKSYRDQFDYCTSRLRDFCEVNGCEPLELMIRKLRKPLQ